MQSNEEYIRNYGSVITKLMNHYDAILKNSTDSDTGFSETNEVLRKLALPSYNVYPERPIVLTGLNQIFTQQNNIMKRY